MGKGPDGVVLMMSAIRAPFPESGRRKPLSGGVATAMMVLLTAASSAHAQRLLTLVPNVEQASSAGDLGPSIGPVQVAVEVDLELLRTGPAWLEVPTPEGGVLSADRSVFEDRGGGDLMWSGGQPGAGYDTVVLTVEGGRLVGRFGAAGGGAYQIHAERDGRGGMAALAGRAPDAPVPLCALHEDAEDFHDLAAPVAAASVAADPPERVVSPGSHDTLDILVAYTATAAKNWERRGGALAAIRHAGDYLKMVFRNNRLGVEPRIVHVAEASAALDRAGRGPEWRTSRLPLARLAKANGELLYLRHEHRADLVHVFAGERARLLGACGSAGLMPTKGATAEGFSVEYVSSIYGQGHIHSWSTNHSYLCRDYVVTFVHEIGHGLGADHDPRNAVLTPGQRFRPYATGHMDDEVMPRLGTAMSVQGQIEPFFSTPRIRPWGAVLGVANEQDNERTLRETVHMGVRYSDYLESLEGLPAQPTNLRVWFDNGAARLSWRDNAPEADGYVVRTSVPLGSIGDGDVSVEGRTEATIPLATGPPGTPKFFCVQARKGDKRSLCSDWALLFTPGGRIEAPSDVSATRSYPYGFPTFTVHWTDNSHNEEWFEVQLVSDGELIARNREAADTETSYPHAISVEVQDDAEYSVRVFAGSSWGQSGSSETVTFRWAQPGVPAQPTGVTASAIGPTTARVAWTAEPGVSYSVDASLVGWTDWLVNRPTCVLWRSDAGRLWCDHEGLARGGRYYWRIQGHEIQGSGRLGVPSHAYLTLGERGVGPRASSDVSWSTADGGEIRVNWRDNSSDELGFEVQVSATGTLRHWTRKAVVPPNTTSAVVESPGFEDAVFRVLAWNARGYSRSSSSPLGPPRVTELTAVAGDAEVSLAWSVGLTEPLTGMQVRWKPTADLPFDEAVDTWKDVPASDPASLGGAGHPVMGEFVVTGLGNGADYTFAVRAVTASGAGPASTVTATPTKGACRADEETLCLHDSRFEVKTDWWTADGSSGPGRVVPEGTDDSGLFSFFDPSNWETLVKVLDGCDNNGRMWVLGASTTDLGYRFTVTDTISGESRSYENDLGRPAPAIVDTDAFTAPCFAGGASR